MQKLNKEPEEKILELIRKNQLIEAVTLVNNELGLGIKESNDIVDNYRNSLK
ncbi:MAG: hypothetical protein U0W24_17125 [Bacteroidales bacterium]